VPLIQLICVGLAIPLLLGLAFYFGWRQVVALGEVREQTSLPAEENRYQRRQAHRRLVGCGLMALLALLLAGAQLFLEDKAQALAEQRDALPDDGSAPPLTEPERDFARMYACYWIVCLLVLMAIVALAGVDLWETRRRGLREQRKLLDDQRLMLERQVERYRQKRKGLN
jgi:hypothetical protein